MTIEPLHRRIRTRMGGMLSVDEVTAFGCEEQAAVKSMGWGSGTFDLIVETEGNLVQTQTITSAIGELMLRSPLKSRRIAIIRSGVLTRMQARRMSKVRSSVEVFETEADALAWLAER